MYRLIRDFVVRIWYKQPFLTLMSIYKPNEIGAEIHIIEGDEHYRQNIISFLTNTVLKTKPNSALFSN